MDIHRGDRFATLVAMDTDPFFGKELVKDGWKYVTLTEDWEFTADQLIEENKIYFCDEAVFYDEQPTDLKVMWRQRVRWSRGRWLVCLARFKDLLRSLFKPKRKNGNKNKFSLYDMTVKVTPVFLITAFLFIARIIAVALAPIIFPEVYTFGEIFMSWLSSTLIVGGIGYIGLMLSAVVVYIAERKRIKKVSFFMKAISVILWPIFLFVATPAEFVAVFSKILGWKEIPHKNTTNFEDLN
jgi:cellulose synthase/poly-beta-1,6-N-acetylglucosamine synthase-like glycosyltransferase